MFLKELALAGAVTVLSSTTALAGCGLSAGNVNILGNDFAAVQAVVGAAQDCAGDGVTVSANLTTEHRDLQVAALTANPAQYSSAIVANSSIVPLLNDGLIRPLDDLVAKYGQDLQPSQLITIEGKVMAVAFMANAQHCSTGPIFSKPRVSSLPRAMKRFWQPLLRSNPRGSWITL